MLRTNVSLSGKTVLVTGAAGFVGANLVLRLIADYPDIHIVGVDSLNDYYDVSIKEYRLEVIKKALESTNAKWTFIKTNIADKNSIDSIFREYSPSVVVNLAAQAGVRYSITNPDVYIPQGTNVTVEFSGMAGSKSLELYLPDANTYIENSTPVLSVMPPKRLHDALGLLNDMFKKLASICKLLDIFFDAFFITLTYFFNALFFVHLLDSPFKIERICSSMIAQFI